MPEIGTSGSMSEDGKRSVATWPKLPRPSSTLPELMSHHVYHLAAIEGIVLQKSASGRSTFQSGQQ